MVLIEVNEELEKRSFYCILGRADYMKRRDVEKFRLRFFILVFKWTEFFFSGLRRFSCRFLFIRFAARQILHSTSLE